LSDAATGRAPGARRFRTGVPEWAAAEPARLQRYGRAWQQALHTARRFVHEFGAARVAVIGDLVHPDAFRRDSEIELVVWGLRADVLWRAVARAWDEYVSVRIHDGDAPDERAASLVQSEAIELARRGREG